MDDLYTIGKLSKAVNISADTLRYYDEIGLLKPKYTDEFTGYRYYSLEQAGELNRILELKAFGFSLGEIKKMLAHSGTADFYRKRLSALLLEKLRLDSITEKLYTKISALEQEEEKTMKKVLVVDDAAFMRMMCKDGLQKNGFEVVGEAEHGEGAIEKFKELSPDIVIMDIMMPIMDGIRALRRIKSLDPNAVVVMISAVSQRAMVIEALQTGARRFIAKPFNMTDLIAAANDAMSDTVPFNPETLRLLSLREGDEAALLSQKSIDEITLIAKASTAKAQEMAEHYIETYSESKQAAAAEVKAIEKDPTHELLNKIISGQDEMIKLLRELIQKKDGIT